MKSFIAGAIPETGLNQLKNILMLICTQVKR